MIVVDNNSTDNTKEIAAKLGAKVIKETKQGVGAARCAGTALAENELIINLDADSRLPADFLIKLEKMIQKYPQVVCWGARGRFYEVPTWKNHVLFLIHLLLYPPAYIFSRKKLGPMGYCLVFKKADYQKTVGFNAEAKFGEDGMLAKELAKLGKVKLSFKLVCNVSDRRYRSVNHSLIVYLINFLHLCLKGTPWKNNLT